jgi:vitamin B12 transporter
MTLQHACCRQILACLAILSIACHLAARTVSARITDEQNRPLEDVSVTDGIRKVFTTAGGDFTIKAETDSLLVYKLGYESCSLAVSEFPSVLKLKVKPVMLNKVRVVERYEPAFLTALDKTIIQTDSDKSGSNLPSELLKESSVSAGQTSLTGENQALSLLGNLSRHTLVILDGVPLNRLGEAVDLSTLPLEAIKRIELVKGSASLYGGASAIGGIIDLYTSDKQTAQALSLKQETGFGSFGLFRHSYFLKQQTSVLSTSVTVSQTRADNDFPYRPRPWWNLEGKLRREHNRKQQQNLSFSLFANAADIAWQYRCNAETVRRQLPGPVNFLSIYENAYLSGQNLQHNLHLDHTAKRWRKSLLLWQSEDNTEYNNTRAPNPVYQTHNRQRQQSLGVKHETTYAGHYVLTLEATRQSYALKDLLYPAQSIDETSRSLLAAAVKASHAFEFGLFEYTAQGGFRLDHTRAFGSFPSWRIEQLLTLDGVILYELSAAVGTGFSLPSFYDLYWKGDAQSLGNPDLEPETSLSGSISLQAVYRGYSLQAARYESRVEDLIQWRQTYLYGTVWKPVNIGKARFSNWEFSGRAKPFPWLEYRTSLTLTQARDELLQAELTYTPDFRWTQDFTLTHRGFTLALNLVSTGRQWTTPDNLIDPLPALTLANSTLTYNRQFGQWSAAAWLELDNLFDKQYEIYAYVPQPGFNWKGGISLRYGI